MTHKESLGVAPIAGEHETPSNPRDRTSPTEPNTARPTPPMTQSDYARHSGLSRSHICELVKKGLPLDTPESADAWRRQHVWSRKPPAPAASPEPEAAPERPAELPTEDLAAGASEPIREAWARLLQAERLAWSMVVAAIKGRQPDASRLVAVHALTVKHLIDGRARVLAQAQAEGQTVSATWVRQTMLAHDGVVAALIRNMPRQLAGRIAPHDPEHCERELDRWVQEVALATLHSTDPWR